MRGDLGWNEMMGGDGTIKRLIGISSRVQLYQFNALGFQLGVILLLILLCGLMYLYSLIRIGS